MSVSSSWRCHACSSHEWLSQGRARLTAIDAAEYLSQSRISSGSAATYAGASAESYAALVQSVKLFVGCGTRSSNSYPVLLSFGAKTP
eukprot:7974013-Lingulodinium_polyedra.AAC.1